MITRATAVFFVGTLLAGSAQATLIDRGGGLIYDDVLDVTWLQDANYAKTSGYDSDGLMTWDSAMIWADQLIFAGYDDWRLPAVEPVNSVAFNNSFSNNGTTDRGYGATGLGWGLASEMGHMFYVSLGNLGTCAPNNATPGTCVHQPGAELTNTGPFTDLLEYGYWSSTMFNAPQYPFLFSFMEGDQNNQNHVSSELRAWAVRDGDVAAAEVPEPQTLGIFLTGLGLLGFMAMRRVTTSACPT